MSDGAHAAGRSVLRVKRETHTLVTNSCSSRSLATVTTGSFAQADGAGSVFVVKMLHIGYLRSPEPYG